MSGLLLKKITVIQAIQPLYHSKEILLIKSEKIVKGGYPMLHVVGDADDLVPVAENTAIFEQTGAGIERKHPGDS